MGGRTRWSKRSGEKTRWYHNRSEWGWILGDGKAFNASSIIEGWKDIVSNPVNWIVGASIYASSVRKVFDPKLFKEGEFVGNRKWFYYNGEQIGYIQAENNYTFSASFNIPEEYQGLGLGSEMFKRGVRELGYSDFAAEWVKKDMYKGGMSTNLKMFNEAKAKGLTDTEAAWETWTGQQAKNAGYNAVKVTLLKNGDVKAVFSLE